MWESRVLQRAFERLELHEGKLSRAVLRGGGGGDVTSLPDTWVGNHPGLPGPITLFTKVQRRALAYADETVIARDMRGFLKRRCKGLVRYRFVALWGLTCEPTDRSIRNGWLGSCRRNASPQWHRGLGSDRLGIVAR